MLRTLFSDVLDWLHPPICLGCEKRLVGQTGLCGFCRASIEPKNRTFCLGCGVVLPAVFAGRMTCVQCGSKKYPFERVVVFGEYRDDLRALILKGKTQSGELLMEVLGLVLAEVKADLFKGLGDVEVTAIPSPWIRSLVRGHNSAASLASGVASQLKCRLNLGLLRRARSTPRQMTLSRPKRLENIRGAFKMGKSLPAKASTVLLVDDVMTTGATILEAAKVLKGGGIGKVIPVVLARTP